MSVYDGKYDNTPSTPIWEVIGNALSQTGGGSGVPYSGGGKPNRGSIYGGEAPSTGGLYGEGSNVDNDSFFGFLNDVIGAAQNPGGYVLHGAGGVVGDIASGWKKFGKKRKRKIAKWEAKQRKNRGRKKPVAKQPPATTGGASVSGGSVSSSVGVPGYSTDSALGRGLPNVGVPNINKRVNQIVDSLIKADKLQRESALEGLRNQYQSAGQGISRGGLAYDKIVRGLAAASDVMSDRELAEGQKIQSIVAGQGGFDPAGSATAHAAQAAQSEDLSAAESGVDSSKREKQAQLSMFNALRGADRMRVSEDLASLGGEFRGAQAELAREARERSLELPLKRLEIEQQLQDNAIKKALAAFELASARENILNTRMGREGSRAELGLKQDEIRYSRAEAARARKEALKLQKLKQKEWQAADASKRQNLVNEILYGKLAKRRVNTGFGPTGTPVYEDVYEPVGVIPTTIGEAVGMLRNAGVGKAEANRIARQWARNQVVASSGQAAGLGVGALGAASGWFGGR